MKTENTLVFSTESMISIGYYRIAFNQWFYEMISIPIETSYNVFLARIFSLTYAEFMRFARDNFNATLVGKHGGYITPIFKNKNDCDAFVQEINNRWKRIKKS